ncbi:MULTISPECIES: restriction endonuclease subunit S [Acinetobacter]|uniref:restriction endonuclease subunit S n=1 Tax=Acinetobacter TaxID=469 RepID=UPI001250365C|nr:MULTISPECIES: restriction endonuclease subunit S [Acinetobacter]MBJ9954743.1 restriction endonuclease subunit S [Acinetobacter baumannii]MCU4321610.1 restriction endonuclease subunit S [Acinetobacter bereziniae]MCU4416911.1 restriction endonuclease subunit S [Acinetobacter bereziniae]MDM1785872.1 restriction endonuclease subunit S [Acinetobacter bereziniae]MDP6001475.1 restriction endonuclease subunit S [Acinetobacter bereziniae]
MSDWYKVKFSEFCLITRGASPRPIQQHMAVSGTPWVKISDATASNSRYINSTKEFIRPTSESASRVVYPGDLILSNSATPGLPRFMTIRACVHDGWLLLRDIKGVDKEFLYYLLENEREALLAQGNGSIFTNLKTDILKEHIVNMPPLLEQKAIASVFSSLDDKIDLLHRQNKTLETMAETLFRQWFIEEAKEDWEEKQLGSLLTVKRGGSPRPIQDYLSDSGYRWLKISDVTSLNSPFVFNIKEHIKEEGLSKTTLLKAGKLVLSNSATPAIPKILMVDTCIHDGWLHFPVSSYSNEYLYLLFNHIRPELLQLGNGSIFTNLKTDILKEYVIKHPDGDTLQKFQSVVDPIFSKLLENAKQIQTLELLRDTLLPKLMSGEVRVQYQTEEVA